MDSSYFPESLPAYVSDSYFLMFDPWTTYLYNRPFYHKCKCKADYVTSKPAFGKSLQDKVYSGPLLGVVWSALSGIWQLGVNGPQLTAVPWQPFCVYHVVLQRLIDAADRTQFPLQQLRLLVQLCGSPRHVLAGTVWNLSTLSVASLVRFRNYATPAFPGVTAMQGAQGATQSATSNGPSATWHCRCWGIPDTVVQMLAGASRGLAEPLDRGRM